MSDVQVDDDGFGSGVDAPVEGGSVSGEALDQNFWPLDIWTFSKQGAASPFLALGSGWSFGVGGTAAPAVPLHVKADTSHVGIRIEENSGTEYMSLQVNAAGSLVIEDDDGDDIVTLTDGAPANSIFVDVSGNVSLGNAAPTSPGSVNKFLHITGTSASIILEDSDATTWEMLSSGGNLKFAEGGTDYVTIDTSGDVGIGSSPVSGVRFTAATAVNNDIAGLFKNTHATGSFGLLVEAGDDSGNYALDVRDKDATSLLKVLGNGHVGLGMSPSVPLQIKSDGDGDVMQIIESASTDILISFVQSSDDEGRMYIRHNNVVTIDLRGDGDSYFNGGDVGIGTTTPSAQLDNRDGTFQSGADIWPTSTVARSGDRVGFFSDSENVQLVLANMHGTIGTNYSEIYLGARGTTDTADASLARIRGGRETATTGNFTSFLAFSLMASNGTFTERFKIDSDGDTGIGEATPTGKLHIVHYGPSQPMLRTNDVDSVSRTNTAWQILRAGAEVGTVTTTRTNTAYNTSSDYRLKENVTPLTGALARLALLPVKRFNFILDPSKTCDGFLAHEVGDVVPEAVTGRRDETEVLRDLVDASGGVIKPNQNERSVERRNLGTGESWSQPRTVPVMQGMDHSKLVPLLTAAVQEVVALNSALTTRVTALEAV